MRRAQLGIVHIGLVPVVVPAGSEGVVLSAIAAFCAVSSEMPRFTKTAQGAKYIGFGDPADIASIAIRPRVAGIAPVAFVTGPASLALVALSTLKSRRTFGA